MSRMSDLMIEIEELVGDALASGCIYDNDVVDYVNGRSILKVDRDIITGMINIYYPEYVGDEQ